MAHLLTKIRTNQERMEAIQEKMNVNLKEMRSDQEHLREETMAGQRTKIGYLASRLNVNQEKAEACHREVKVHQEKTQATIHSNRSHLEESIKQCGRHPSMVRPKGTGPPKGT